MKKKCGEPQNISTPPHDAEAHRGTAGRRLALLVIKGQIAAREAARSALHRRRRHGPHRPSCSTVRSSPSCHARSGPSRVGYLQANDAPVDSGLRPRRWLKCRRNCGASCGRWAVVSAGSGDDVRSGRSCFSPPVERRVGQGLRGARLRSDSVGTTRLIRPSPTEVATFSAGGKRTRPGRASPGGLALMVPGRSPTPALLTSVPEAGRTI